jgi:hypothetical protein
MRNYQAEPVTLSEVDAALTRAIESSSWANQKDDVASLTLLKSFLKSSNTKSSLYVHLISEQPQTTRVYEDPELKKLETMVLADLYANALQHDRLAIVSSTYMGFTKYGSFEYLLNSGTYRPITLYVRRCRGELRGELNEDNFTIIRKVPEVTLDDSPGGMIKFFKKMWKEL